MKKLLPILLLAFVATAATPGLRGHLRLHIEGLTGAQALTLRNRVLGYWQSNELYSRPGKWDNLEWSVVTNASTYDVTLHVAFTSTNIAERVYSNIVNRTSIPTNITGSVTIHYCPIAEDLGTNKWHGCDSEPEANYRIKTWP